MKQSIESLIAGAVHVIPVEALEKKLKEGRPLRIKLGMDPTAPDLHLGHAVVLGKVKDFQDAGHEIYILIGNFTALIGDPTGKSKTRPPLTPEQIALNTATYLEQVGKVIDPARLKIVFNADWFGRLSARDFVALTSKVTLARVTEREDFAQRIAAQQPIALHELLYPLLQGYDSVELKADVELGGTDQTFNLLMGRTLQEEYGQEAQVIITMPLLEGLDGVTKMSKSYGNTIGLTDTSSDAYGKLMSISDTLMWRYGQLLLRMDQNTISALQEKVAAGTAHPMEVKKEIAYKIVAKFWSSVEADEAQEQFEALFQKKDYSQATPIKVAERKEPVWIVELLKELKSVTTSSEARRLIEAGAVKINDEVIKDVHAKITVKEDMQIKVGKHRIYRLIK
jgi:tyrosyl-tRNA synthetase